VRQLIWKCAKCRYVPKTSGLSRMIDLGHLINPIAQQGSYTRAYREARQGGTHCTDPAT
jgi:hypothetical protein